MFTVSTPDSHIERMRSQYVHNRAHDREHRSFEEALLGEPAESAYMQCSKYYTQLRPYLDYYPMERIKVLTTEALRDQRASTLRTLFQFLNVDPSFESEVHEKRHNTSSRKTQPTGVGRLVESLPVKNALASVVPALLKQMYRRVTQRSIERPKVGKALREKIIHELKGDIDRFRDLTGMRFDKWSL